MLSSTQNQSNAGARKAFRQNLQRYGLTGAGGAGDEPVPVGKRDSFEPLKIESEKPLYMRFAELDGSADRWV